MKLTTNYSLKKPEGSDVVNIDDFNYNADIIDNAIQEIKNTSSTNKTNISSLQTKVNNGQNHKVTQDNGSGTNLSTGYDLNVLNNLGTGFYYGSNFVNAPEAGWIMVEHVKYGNSSTQKCTVISSERVYIRRSDNGTWSAWREL